MNGPAEQPTVPAQTTVSAAAAPDAQRVTDEVRALLEHRMAQLEALRTVRRGK